ncbi:hypothetical protein TKK_0015349 [Trichogramma kaykai]
MTRRCYCADSRNQYEIASLACTRESSLTTGETNLTTKGLESLGCLVCAAFGHYGLHVVQTGMTAPYGGGVFPPQINRIGSIMSSTNVTNDAKPLSISIKDENLGSHQQSAAVQVTQANPSTQCSTKAQLSQGNFSPPSPSNEVEQQAMSEVFQAAVAAAVVAANSNVNQQAVSTTVTNDIDSDTNADANSLIPASSNAMTPSIQTQINESKGQPKRLHVSNIPFRFRDPDLRAMFGVSSLIVKPSF